MSDIEPAGPESRNKALALVLRALERYPAPVPVPPPGGKGPPRYVPALDVAMAVYAERFQQSEEEATIKAAFAAAAPKILDRASALGGTIMDAIVDGERAPAAQADYLILLCELSTLATVFVGPAGGAFGGSYVSQYIGVCETIRSLIELSPR